MKDRKGLTIPDPYLDYLQVLSLGALTWEASNELASKMGRRPMAAGEFSVARAYVYSLIFEKVYTSGHIKGINQTRLHWLYDKDSCALHSAFHSFQDASDGAETYEIQAKQLAISMSHEPPSDWGKDSDLDQIQGLMHVEGNIDKAHAFSNLIETFASFKEEMEWIASWDLIETDPPLTLKEGEELDQLLDEGFEDMLLELDVIN